ncbi:MAG: hypothetical protein IJ128_07875 [Firmicutes bacterium]|nr:hypothetical protein [Bacillota bacterium]
MKNLGCNKKTNRTAYFLAALFLLITIPILYGCGSEEPEEVPEETTAPAATTAAAAADGEHLYDFSAKEFDGDRFTEEGLSEKDLTIITVWATDKWDSVNELWELAAIEEQLMDNVRLATYCADGGDKTDRAEDLLNQAGFGGTALYKAKGDLKAVVDKVEEYPTAFFFDSEGNQVAEPMVGVPDDTGQAYREKVNQCLGEMGKGMIGP